MYGLGSGNLYTWLYIAFIVGANTANTYDTSACVRIHDVRVYNYTILKIIFLRIAYSQPIFECRYYLMLTLSIGVRVCECMTIDYTIRIQY